MISSSGRRGGLQPSRSRIDSLDVLRGVAVLGIYMVNVQTFAMIPQAYQNPFLALDFSREAQAAAKLVAVGFEGKFIAIFSALFGAGVALMAGSGEDLDRLALHRRRMAWLAAVGAAHAYLLWFGDILLPYAIAGLVLARALSWSAERLAWTGAALIAAAAAVLGLLTVATASMSAEDYAELAAENWALPAAAAQEWRTALQGSWFERAPRMFGYALEAQLSTLIVFLPRILGMMMVGAALLRSGFFSDRWPIGRLLAAAALAPLGAFVGWAGMEICYAARFDFLGCAPGTLLRQFANPIQALGYAALVMLACRAPILALVRAPFAAAGRLALTNYLGCTVFSVLWFYGPPGLGRIGELNHAEQARLVLVVWAVMLASSTAWLTVFRFGPMEWAWRSLAYRRRQPMLKSAK